MQLSINLMKMKLNKNFENTALFIENLKDYKAFGLGDNLRQNYIENYMVLEPPKYKHRLRLGY